MQVNRTSGGRRVQAPLDKQLKPLRNMSLLVLVIKIFILIRITPLTEWTYQGHMWLGADGENYLQGVKALSRDGLFSNQSILYAWPAGYPVFIYLFGIFGKANALTFVGLFQSAIFSYAVYAFGKQILYTNLKKISKILVFLLLINPTLSLNSLAVGYESITATGYIFILTLFLYYQRVENLKSKRLSLLLIALTLSFISALQPRLLVSGIFIAILLATKNRFKLKTIFKSAILILIILSMPLSLIVRNHVATGLNVLSTNLGVTMNIGAGDDATGAYRGSWKGVPCVYNESDSVKADSAQVKCVLRWYIQNPRKSAYLFWKKSEFFWSPWFGPKSVGTMARNPWQQINPLKSVANNPNGFQLIYGNFGVFISWLWMFLSFLSMIIGFRWLITREKQLKQIGLISTFIIIPSWLISLVTLGDNRFRLPIMGCTIFLQLIGLKSVFDKQFRFLGKISHKN